MNIILNPHEVEHVSDVMVKDANDLDSCLNALLQQLGVLSTIWQGQDSVAFCKNVGRSIELFKTVPNCMDQLGRLVRVTSGNIEEEDDSFSKDLQKEVLDYEQPNSDNKLI